ncbi:hypothetical protein GCM10027399_17540 [Curvibacter fontanus]
MWPFKKKASALAVVSEIVSGDQNKALLAEFGLKVDDLQVLLLEHALLLLAVRFLPVSPVWEVAIGNSLALNCAEYDPQNKLRLGLVLYQYPFDESPFDKASFYGSNNSVCRPIVKVVEYFYILNAIQPDRMQVLTHAMMCTGTLVAAAKVITGVEKSMTVGP